ncbi:MAG: hypothetical protein OER43_13935 [Gammaproteobacteria bacterium]|nr:hypothetical protein [Gammaproteobacteria bacterium]MDH3414053.1 hypothetical protein [Gammaproteobacteria bacterium]
MKMLKMLVLSGMTVCVLALAGCSDRIKDPGADRSPETSDDLRHRIVRTQTDR